ncbi:hypothetical protein C3K47_04140 [Solitalea longa]|uniref:DUF2971 domain-containing protein n=1 Tax=Solitalea longa TaxID=2079460 RepID=A0A2S5A901_9SPHI|nr:DUF2971 domain-containing protein [Solitalea longa]POY38593.1 hypothetical protein C3K47_04140 [Solitalea longa]
MFKFYTIPDLKTLENIIGEPTLKFSSAFNLNDPFELKFNLVLDPYAEGQENEFFKAHPGGTIKDFKDWQESVENNDGFLWYTEQVQRNYLSKLITLCSFTEINTNNLMWSHYTNNHRGICVEYSDALFDKLKNIKEFLVFGNVEYSELPPEVDSLEDRSSKIKKMLFNKQVEWKYEREHRVILQSDNDTDFISIEPNDIKAVYIGSKATEDITNKAMEICQYNNFDCFYGISLGKTYEVQFKKHKEGTFHMRTFWSELKE